MKWYSARLLYIILVDSKRPRRRNSYEDRAILFRARDRKHALNKALVLGAKEEVEYMNVRKQRVRWALVEVMALDCIGHIKDGAEVSSRLFRRTDQKPVPYSHRFQPKRSRPVETGIVETGI